MDALYSSGYGASPAAVRMLTSWRLYPVSRRTKISYSPLAVSGAKCCARRDGVNSNWRRPSRAHGRAIPPHPWRQMGSSTPREWHCQQEVSRAQLKKRSPQNTNAARQPASRAQHGAPALRVRGCVCNAVVRAPKRQATRRRLTKSQPTAASGTRKRRRPCQRHAACRRPCRNCPSDAALI